MTGVCIPEFRRMALTSVEPAAPSALAITDSVDEFLLLAFYTIPRASSSSSLQMMSQFSVSSITSAQMTIGCRDIVSFPANQSLHVLNLVNLR